VAELYNRTAQIWTSLEEDEKIQQLEQREEKLNVVVQDLKKRQKTMDISLRMKATQELKNLQEEVKTVQEQKQARQAQLEPFQQQAEGMIDELQTEKGKWEQVLTERREVLTEHITTQGLETLAGKSAEAKEKVTELAKKFHALEVALQKVH
jgi:hypothetical protein